MDRNVLYLDIVNILSFISVLAETYAGNVIVTPTFVKESPLGLLQCAHRCLEYSACLSVYYSKSKLECRLNYKIHSLVKYVPNDYEGFRLILRQDFQQILHIQESSSAMSCSANKRRVILKSNAFTCVPFKTVDSGTVNVAVNKRTEQSSTAFSGVSGKAVDGNRNPYYFNYSCACTDTEINKEKWWRVDLAKHYSIDKIQIKNRGESLGHRLNNFGLFIGFEIADMDIVGFYDGAATDEELIIFNFLYPVKGQHVKIVMKGTTYLTLCELYQDMPEPNSKGKTDDPEKKPPTCVK